MEKEKIARKRSSDPRDTLPAPPPNPQQHHHHHHQQQKSGTQILPEAFRRLLDYKDREAIFLKNLNEAITSDCKKIIKCEPTSDIPRTVQNSSSASGEIGESINKEVQQDKSDDCEMLREECEGYIMPLLGRTGPSISAALVAHDAFEQLNRLHGLLDQMLSIQEQNYQMRRHLRDVRTLCELKKLQKKEAELPNEGEVSDAELDLDNHASLLSTILAAGNSASTKRSSSKRQRERSKSVIADDIQMYLEKEKSTPTQMRRQSAFSESKAKVSKWTKVKAAFKWERANVPILNEGKSSDSGIGLTPINHEVARYLRVPSVPCAGSSADSVLSSSSGHLLSCGSVPATPGTISSASSIEDVGPTSEELREHRDSSKSDSRCYSRVNEDETRRSRSLDGDSVIGPTGQSKSKTPWRKVKDIIQTHRGSFKGKTRSRSIKSTGSITGSRDASPCESLDTASNFEDRNDGSSSTQTSAMPKNLTSSSQGQESCSFGSSPTGFSPGREEMELKLSKSSSKGSRKSRILSDFESLPEDVIVDLKTNYSKPPPSPLNLTPRQDSSDAEIVDFSYSPTIFHKGSSKSLKPKKFWTPGNSSVPSSPSRHSEFFGEFESEDLSSGDFSEPSTPHRKLSPKSSLQVQQEEINEKYFELREKLTQEFEMKRQEWEKIRAACSASTSCAYTILSKDEPIQSNKSVPTKLLEENLSADFKKKLHKWRVRKQSSGSNIKDPQISPTKESEQKKIDWNLWKTGQLKLEGQGLTPLPDQKDLPEDFQKKLEQWKKMKESNTVPPYNSQDSLKRSGKSGHSSKSDSSKKSKEDIDREKQRPERDKVKSHEKDKLEKLSKLKAIVTDSPAKEIEVQTSIGVMKFEGISRKFTRKLYEWEKARGIGPESSTFALLHPGYRPLDVGNASHEMKTHESSPTLGRSLSLDSISPNPSVPSISHQPSSLSLSNMDELKDNNGVNDRKVSSNPELDAKDNNNIDEPEAVIVEVEDDIIETAAPLLAAMPIVEQQTPVYKYEVPCSDFCNAGKRDTVLQRDAKVNRLSNQTLENVNYLKLCLHGQESFKKNIQHCQSVLASLKETLPELEKCTKEGSQTAQDALDLVKKLVSDLLGLLDTLKDDEACCKEMISEKTSAIDSKLKSLDKSINLVCKYLDMQKQQAGEHIPKINITSDDGVDKSVAIVSTTPTVFQTQVVINQPKVHIGTAATTNNNTQNSINDRPDPVEAEIPDITAKKLNRNASNGSKKKLRLRKMGSRQNSKTESDSSDEDNQNVILENPRRLKRKTSRAKKNPDDELKKNDDKKDDGYVGDDIVYVLKIKPGQMIKQSEVTREPSDSKVLISPTETCIQLMGAPPQENLSNSTSIFIKTKRKIFTTVEEGSGESKVVIARDIESSSASERNDKENEFDKSKTVVTSLPPIPQSPNSQKRVEQKITPPKEPSPSIRFMIAKYNQKLAMERSSRSPGSSGSCSPVTLRSPVLDHRVRDQRTKYQEQVELVVKSASAGNIRQNDACAKVSCSPKETSSGDNKISKSCSADALPCNWKSPPGNVKDSTEYECKPPLACDSLKILHKHSGAIPKAVNQEPPKKEHLYRKNKDKPTSLFTKSSGSTVKKIGTKSGKADFIWRRSISSSNAEMWPIQPDKSDNTVPKITRKLDSNKSSPEEKKHFPFDLPCHPSVSAPTTPSEDCGRPKTPISERALKLQKAKEEFLRGYVVHPSLHRDEPKDDMWKKRLSAVSVGSDTSNEDCALSKSASVGVINSSDTDSHNMAGYVSLPRAVARSGKITSKFGFSSLASKFRKVKMRRGSKDQTKMNAVSALCRQSLAIDIMPEEANASGGEGQLMSSTRNLAKSGSSQAIGFGTFFKKNDKLNKSKSTNTVPNEDSLKK